MTDQPTKRGRGRPRSRPDGARKVGLVLSPAAVVAWDAHDGDRSAWVSGLIEAQAQAEWVVQFWAGNNPRSVLVRADSAADAESKVRAQGGIDVSARKPYSERELEAMRSLGLDLGSV